MPRAVSTSRKGCKRGIAWPNAPRSRPSRAGRARDSRSCSPIADRIAPMFHVGLNPYGLAYTLGLQGAGTARARPDARGLDEFVEIARGIDARCIEFDWRWLMPQSNEAIARIARDCRAAGMTVLCSAWLAHQPGETLDDAFRVAAALEA